jgi:hypothetical protein
MSVITFASLIGGTSIVLHSKPEFGVHSSERPFARCAVGGIGRLSIAIVSASRLKSSTTLNVDHDAALRVAALVYIEITMHIETFARLNLEHIIDYIILTVLLVGINKMFFADMYATVKRLRLESLNEVKDAVFKNNKLSFEILKYCYERRISTASIANFIIQTVAIAFPYVLTGSRIRMKCGM